MTCSAILACREPRSACWQLGPLPARAGSLVLFGWKRVPPPVDSGVPQDMAVVFARALTSIARLTFPCSLVFRPVTSQWTPQGDDWIRRWNKGDRISRIKAALRRPPVADILVSTWRPETALRLFDDPAYPWWLQGQAVLLSERNAMPPDIDDQHLPVLFGEDWLKQASSLAAAGTWASCVRVSMATWRAFCRSQNPFSMLFSRRWRERPGGPISPGMYCQRLCSSAV